MRELLIATTVAFVFAGPAFAKDAIPLPAQRGTPPPDPRCASTPGFVYEPSTGTCARLGGFVGAEVGNSPTPPTFGR
jgi:hypothetical protein